MVWKTPRHTHTPCTGSLYRGCIRYDNEGIHKVWQACYCPTKEKKPKREERYENPPPATPAQPLHLTRLHYRGNTQGTTKRYVMEDAMEKKKKQDITRNETK